MQNAALYQSLAELPPQKRKEALLALCRTDSATFAAYVLEDEATGRRIKMARIHKEWHAHCNKHKRFILWGSVEIGKSVQVSIGYVAWRIGCNPRLRVAIMSNTQRPQAMKIIAGLQKVLLSERYREIFPHITKGESWNSTTITVAGWDGRNPTVQAFGAHGNILGSRIDLLVLDDPLSQENTRTEEMREDLYNWYNETLVGRLTRGAQVIMVANAWHPRDMLHKLHNERVWHTERYPIWEKAEEGEKDAVYVEEKGCWMKSCWSEQWPIDRIMEKREELEDNQKAFARQYECVARDDATEIFKEDWMMRALKKGAGLPWCENIGDAISTDGKGETFLKIFIGVDLATKRPPGRAKRSTDETVFTVIGMRPNWSRRLLCIESGRFHGTDIIRSMISLHRRFTIPGGEAPEFWVETNGAQKYITDFADDPAVIQALGGHYADELEVRCFDTHRYNKFDEHFGVESLGGEMHIGRWEFPSPAVDEAGKWPFTKLNEVLAHLERDLRQLLDDMVRYSPLEHSGDRLMATWIGREGCRIGLGEVKIEKNQYRGR